MENRHNNLEFKIGLKWKKKSKLHTSILMLNQFHKVSIVTIVIKLHCYKEYPTHQTVCSELPIVGTNSPKWFGQNWLGINILEFCGRDYSFWIKVPIVGTFDKIRISTPTFGRYVSHFCVNVPE